jgi:hypothetical protein
LEKRSIESSEINGGAKNFLIIVLLHFQTPNRESGVVFARLSRGQPSYRNIFEIDKVNAKIYSNFKKNLTSCSQLIV